MHEADGPDTDSDSEEEDVESYGGKAAAAKPVMMLQTGMEGGVGGVHARQRRRTACPNPYKNHSLAELGCRRGYRSPR